MPKLKAFFWSFGPCVLLIASGAFATGSGRGFATFVPLYLLLTILVAWRVGFRAAISVALCATLGLDFFFTEPRFTLRIASLQDLLALLSFAAVALIISNLSDRIHAKSDQVRCGEQQQRALYQLSRSAMLIDWKGSVGYELCAIVRNHFELSGVALWDDRQRQFYSAGDAFSSEESLHASFRAQRDFNLDGRLERIRLLRFGLRPIGVLFLKGSLDRFTADSIAALMETNLERVEAIRAEVSAASQARSEQLRAAVLDGLAHAVKTPLATILFSSSGLREIGSLSPMQMELACLIEKEAISLAALTDKLLRTNGAEKQTHEIRTKLVEVTPMLDSVLDELRTVHKVTRVHRQIGARTTLCAEPDLLRLILLHLLENALKYSPDGSQVSFTAEAEEADLHLTVHNIGTIIQQQERQLIFERFYRSPSTAHSAPGTGLGLSIAMRAVLAHGGSTWVDSDPVLGTTFHVRLPLKGKT